MRRKISTCRISFLLLTGCLWLILFACEHDLPHLELDVQDVYDSSRIDVYYRFYGESDYQTCRVTVDKVSYSSDIRVYFKEERLPHEGSLNLDLAEGNYRIRFSVLSDRGIRNEVISSMDETREFTIHLSGM